MESAVSGLLGAAFFFGFFALVIASAVWFFRGPASAADRYVDSLALQFQNPQDVALFRNVYRTKDPKSTTIAWLLTALLSPTIGYIYQQKWTLAVLSFVTIQGFFVWWFVALFTTPLEVLARNKRLADEAFNQVMIGRGGSGFAPQPQVINVNQYAYMPHPGQPATPAAAVSIDPPASSDTPSVTHAGAPVSQVSAPSPAPATVRIVESGPIGGPPANPPTTIPSVTQ